MSKSGCLVCGASITYANSQQKHECAYCREMFSSLAACENGHFVCDDCHTKPGEGVITRECLQHQGTDPIALANAIMHDSAIKMHGPEHHYLVPAVLITCYYNKIGKREHTREALEKAKQRAAHVPGGFCGSNGSCGAGIGSGIFMSVITQATPLSTISWQQANFTTAKSLLEIAKRGGPRCCKRDSYLAIQTAIDQADEYFSVSLTKSKPLCGFTAQNKQCLHEECDFYPAS